jgi:hypothetical protein
LIYKKDLKLFLQLKKSLNFFISWLQKPKNGRLRTRHREVILKNKSSEEGGIL